MKSSFVLIFAVSIGKILSIVIASYFKVVTTSVSIFSVANAKKSPEMTSTALKVHKAYTIFPPHDTDLYDIMQVHPNATLAQITKSYRILSRRYHPDKQGQRQRQSENSKQRLQRLQTAYEILSDDSKRLPYHRYGLIDPNLAATLLLGPRVSPQNYYNILQQQQQSHSSSFFGSSSDNTAQLFDIIDQELLHLMGYDYSILELLANAAEASSRGDYTDPSALIQEHRVRTVAALLLESLRPLVEGRLDTRVYAHMLTQDCDRWKRLPLGAQIIRSVGRAYRHEGREFLRKKNVINVQENSNTKKMLLQLKTDLSIGFRRKWRSTKDILEAAAISGRLAMAERSFDEQERKRKQQQLKKQKMKQTNKRIEYEGKEWDCATDSPFLPQMDDFMWSEEEQYESLEDLEEEQNELEKIKAQQSLLQTLQIEALWKVCKIDLDRVVRQACGMILSGEYFFSPSHQSSSSHHVDSDDTNDGWVTSSGRTMYSESAKVAAAEAMIMTGEIMVQQSKVGTAWKQ